MIARVAKTLIARGPRMTSPVFQKDWPKAEQFWRKHVEFEQSQQAHEDRREFERRDVQWPARLVLPEGALSCLVYDLSLGGARVKLVAQLQKHQRVRLDLDKFPPLNADVVWLGIGMVGVRFTDDSAYIARTLGSIIDR
jgi:hypothetical protein